LDLPFLFRDDELGQAERFLDPAQVRKTSRLLVLRGESGVGKSRFAKFVLGRLLERNSNVLAVYLDLSEDEFFAAHLFECLCYICWSEAAPQVSLPLSIPPGRSFSHFLQDAKVKSDLVHHLHSSVAKAAIDWIPYLGPLPPAPPNEAEGGDRVQSLPDLTAAFFAFLKKISGRTACYITLDNYQFLPRPQRLFLESQISSLRRNVCLFTIDRTIGGNSDLSSFLCFSSDQHVISLKAFDRIQVSRLISEALPGFHAPDQVAQDCYLKTSGNLKEIEFYVQSVAGAAEPEAATVEVFLDTIGHLPNLARRLLALVSLFPAGLKLPYVRAIIQRLEEIGPDSDVDKIVGDLALLGYIVKNSRSGQVVRPAHEKVVFAVRNTISDREILTLHKAVVDTLDNLLSRGLATAEYAYLLHCFVGVLTEGEYERSVHRITELIDLQHRADKFHYVVNLYGNLPDKVVAQLPAHTVDALLDSFQKTSEFILGMNAIERLRLLGRASTALERALIKYLIQTYRYQDALDILDRLVPDDELILNQAMTLQYIGRDAEAHALVEQARSATVLRRHKAILLRNSAHLYCYDDALSNLRRALEFFERSGEPFETATIRNNLGIVYLWGGEVDRARHYFLEAREVLAGLASNEVYQPLINLGVTSLFGGRIEDGLLYLLEARQWVPSRLTLDQLILEANITVAQVLQETISLRDAEERYSSYYADARSINDEKLHNHLGFNLVELQRFLDGMAKVSVSDEFLEGTRSRRMTGFEVFVDFPAGERTLKLLLALSPHWRY
jgi:tetratricopeptide (TPR) repeat protein